MLTKTTCDFQEKGQPLQLIYRGSIIPGDKVLLSSSTERECKKLFVDEEHADEHRCKIKNLKPL